MIYVLLPFRVAETQKQTCTEHAHALAHTHTHTVREMWVKDETCELARDGLP